MAGGNADTGTLVRSAFIRQVAWFIKMSGGEVATARRAAAASSSAAATPSLTAPTAIRTEYRYHPQSTRIRFLYTCHTQVPLVI
jgi:hypothetical protein